MTLVYHTFYADFSGETPQEVVAALYAASREELDLGYEDWWRYQQDLWHKLDGARIPDVNTPDAEAALIEVLLSAGALETGPRATPAPQSATEGMT